MAESRTDEKHVEQTGNEYLEENHFRSLAMRKRVFEPRFNADCITKTSLFKYTENFTTKKWKFPNNKFWYFFHTYTQNILCGYSLEPPLRGGSNEYPQSMFLNRNKKNNVYPCKPQFYDIKVGFKGVNII